MADTHGAGRLRQRFSGLLLQYRGRTRLTQRQLASRVGVNTRSVQGWETGVMYPSGPRLQALLAALLEAGGLAAGHELEEAKELWAAVDRESARMHPPFEENWFLALLASAPTPARPPARPAGHGLEGRQDWGDAPTALDFVGRLDELATVRDWVLQERCRLVGVLGMGGMGKTSIAAKLAQDVASGFERVYWRGLRNALPVRDWISGAIGFLSDQQQVPPEAESNQLTLLIQLLRDRPSLLVLDNFETLLEPGEREARYRDGLAGYGGVLQAIGETNHQSCLVITSREAPPDWSLLSGAVVRTLELSGLGIDDGRALLRQKGLNGDHQAWTTLIARYGGNSLALKVVGETVRQVFGGDIGGFLAESAAETVFGGIRRLLEEQIGRSSSLEQEVLRVLAVEREPVTIAELLADLGSRAGRGDLLEAITALRKRSLVERAETAGAAAFTVQSVVLEYVTDRLVEEVADELARSRPVLLVARPLIKAQATDYVRETQERLIAQPILQRLESEGTDVEAQLLTALAGWRGSTLDAQGYGPANVVNLLRVLRGNLRGVNLAGLGLHQAYLAGVEAQDASLAGADLQGSVLADAFIYPIRVTLSSDGGLLLAGMSSEEVWLWRVSDRTPLLAVRGHIGPVHGVSLSADGRLLASAGEDGTIRLWSFDPSATSPAGSGAVSTAQSVGTLLGHTSSVLSVVLSPDGDLLVSGGLDGTVRVWDPTSGRLLATLCGHTGPVHGVALSADGQLLVSGSQDGTVRQWFFDRTSGENAARLLSTSRGHSGAVKSVALSDDGEIVASGGLDGTVRLWTSRTGQLSTTLQDHTNAVWGVALSGDGRLLASASFDGTTRLWETATGLPLVTFQGHSSGVRDVSLSADGRQVATCSWDGSIRLWEAASGRRLATLRGVTRGVWDVALSPDGQVLVSGSSDETVRVWAAPDGRLLTTMRGHTAGVRCVALSSDRRLIASGALDGTVRLWDTGANRLLATLHGHTGPAYSVKFSADGRLLASGSEDGTVRLWSLDGGAGRLVATLHGHTGGLRGVSLSADGLLLASCSWDGTVRLWDLRPGRTGQASSSGQQRATLQGHAGPVYAVALSPDKRLLASGGEDGTVRLWHVETAEMLARFEGSSNGIWSVAWNTEARQLVSGSWDGTIRLWEVPGGRLLTTLQGHTDVVRGVALSADGELLASSSHDGTIRLWEMSSGKCLRILRSDRMYERVDITSLTGVTAAQRASLLTLGAVDHAAM